MDNENEQLRQELYEKHQNNGSGKEKKKSDGHTRHMTGEEVMQSLAEADWHQRIAEVHNEAAD